MAQMRAIELAAVGRVASFGDLYDARSDQFLHFSIFRNSIPDSAITSSHNRQTKLQYAFDNTIEEKFNTMDISAGLKLSILGGLFQLEGSGKFFKDTKKSAKSAKASVINSISTEYDRISITDDSLQSIINLNVLEHIDATHVVVGIQWGGHVFVSVEDFNIEDKDQLTVQGNLKAYLTAMAGKISGEGHSNIDVNISDNSELTKFNFEIFGDILPDEVPQNVINALNFIKNATIALQSANNGKGKAIKYTLIPISSLRKVMKIETKINSLMNQVDDTIVQRCVKIFDNMNKNEQKINDLVDSVKHFEKYLPENKTEDLFELQFDYRIYQGQIQKLLSENLILVRSGDETIGKFTEIIEQALKHQSSWHNIEVKFKKLSDELKEQISFLKYLLERGVKLLGKDQTLQDFLFLNSQNGVYILCYSETISDVIGKTMDKMLEMIEKKRQTDIFVAMKTNETKLIFYRNMRLITDYSGEIWGLPDKIETDIFSKTIMKKQLGELFNHSGRNKMKYCELFSIDWNLLKKINKVTIYNGTDMFLITHSDDIYAFGRNNYGRLGFGHNEQVKDPQLIPELCGKSVKDIKFRYKFSVVLIQSGQIYTFGSGDPGQTGKGRIAKNQKPEKISIDNQRIATIDCTDYGSYMLTQTGELYKIGYSYDEIGYGKEFAEDFFGPTKVVFPSEMKIKNISCGHDHILVLTNEGKAFSWGQNVQGQLGLGHNDKKYNPEIIEFAESIKQVSCGDWHSLLLTINGNLFSMGSNSSGQLGIGNKTNHNRPKFVMSEQNEICCYGTISMSIDVNNKLYVWGISLCDKSLVMSPISTCLTSFQQVIDIYAGCPSTLTPVSPDELFKSYYLNEFNLCNELYGRLQIFCK